MDFLRDRLALAPVQALRAMHRYLAKAGGSCGGATRPPGAPPSPHAAIVHAVQQKHASDPWLQVPDCCRFWGLRRVSLLQSLSGDLQTAVVASGPATASARGFKGFCLSMIRNPWRASMSFPGEFWVPVEIVADCMALVSRWNAFQARGQPWFPLAGG